jgi:hypothetical protein
MTPDWFRVRKVCESFLSLWKVFLFVKGFSCVLSFEDAYNDSYVVLARLIILKRKKSHKGPHKIETDSGSFPFWSDILCVRRIHSCADRRNILFLPSPTYVLFLVEIQRMVRHHLDTTRRCTTLNRTRAIILHPPQVELHSNLLHNHYVSSYCCRQVRARRRRDFKLLHDGETGIC